MSEKILDIAVDTLAYYVPPGAGYLRFDGPDRVAFLQRQTTNDVQALNPGHSVTTALTNATASILDLLQLIHEPGEALGAVTLPGRAGDTVSYLKRRIFFNDNVTVADLSEEVAQIDLEGRGLEKMLRRAGIELPELDGVVSGTLGGVSVRLIGQRGLNGTGYRLLFSEADRESMLDFLHGEGATPLPENEHEILRIEAGLPGTTSELTGEYTPLELNLDAIVSATKGCYTGQEVLARQVTYDKVTRRMVGLRLDGMGEPGMHVVAGGRSVGTVTSAVESPRLGPIALAVLKRPFHEAGTEVLVRSDGDEIQGTVLQLPFPK